MLYKNQPAWLKDLCESGQLFDSEAPDFVLTGIEKKKGLDFMHVSMKFNQEQQEQYCFSLHQDYYLLQFTNMPQEKIDWFFRGLEIVR